MERKTWTDIEQAARTDPMMRSVVLAVATGRATKEEALTIMALNQLEYINELKAAIDEFLISQQSPSFTRLRAATHRPSSL